jgi:ribosomal protein S18 acetylase RimI-like enzyme
MTTAAGAPRRSVPPIRRAVAADLDAVTALWIGLFDHHVPLDPVFRLRRGSRGEIRELVRAILRDPDALVLVARDADPPFGALGTCMARVLHAPPIHEETVRAEISDLYVVPEWRRHGLGRALATGAIEWSQQRGAARIEVRVSPRNAEGAGFWRALGFARFMDVLDLRR